MTRSVRRPNIEFLLITMGIAMAVTIVTMFLAGFRYVPSWIPLIPCTVVTMSVGLLVIQQDADVRAMQGGGVKRLMTFGTIYGWLLLVGAPIVAILGGLGLL